MRFCIIFYLAFLMISCEVNSQDLSKKLHDTYENYQEKSIQHQRLNHQEIVPLLKAFESDERFELSVLGQSIEGRDIYQVKLGNGSIPVLLWSQMHGDEPTATEALLDMFNFFKAEGDEFDEIRKEILSKSTLYFIPMLNPDGAERFKRRNALDIDLNRDAQRLQNPESQILKEARDRTNALFGFNLHDQSRFYSAGERSPHPSAIAFLAPAFNFEKDINDIRKRAMQLIVVLDEALQNFIPNKVAKYNDDFEPRAFGDNIQKWGTSTVLVESGGYLGDPEKQYLRKLNYVLLLTALKSIADESYQKEKVKDYFAIPTNDRGLHSLLIRKAKRELNGKKYILDIGMIQYEYHEGDEKAFRYRSSISDLGDLSTFYAYEELDAEGYTAIPGKVYPQVFSDLEAVAKADFENLLKQGYTGIRVENLPKDLRYSHFPINLYSTLNTPNNGLELGGRANFVLEKDGIVDYAIVNGFLYNLKEGKNGVVNGLVY